MAADAIAAWLAENQRRHRAAAAGVSPIPAMPTLDAWTEGVTVGDAPANAERFLGVDAAPPAAAGSVEPAPGAFAPAGAGGLPVARAR